MDLKQKINRYKKEKLHFVRYYKYEFFYANDIIEISAGGEGNDIYRSSLDDTMTLEEIVRECGTEFMSIIEKEPAV